ncbi:MAG: hypothetical protein KAU83_09625, partial [Bacteroidales bacterium]|nr:hypothetical protein [Bacteroidales bacterium]
SDRARGMELGALGEDRRAKVTKRLGGRDLPGFSRRDACGRRTCLPAVVCEGGAESVKETEEQGDN